MNYDPDEDDSNLSREPITGAEPEAPSAKPCSITPTRLAWLQHLAKQTHKGGEPTEAVPFGHYLVQGRAFISMGWVWTNLAQKLPDDQRAKLRQMIEARAKRTDILREIPELEVLLTGLSITAEEHKED